MDSSAQPLPVQLVGVDPVLVGWVRPPRIYLPATGAPIVEYAAFGVVLAVWDMDREYKL